MTLTRDYWLGKYEVTQGQWRAVMGSNPSYFQNGDDYPVEQVTWDEAKAFCDKLNNNSSIPKPAGYRFDLPTEAQWEYACRAGTRTSLNSGVDMRIDGLNNSRQLDEVGWYGGNCGQNFTGGVSYDISGWKERQYGDTRGGTHPFGGKRPNAWGFYDMHGNVLEWCSDWFSAAESQSVDPQGPSSGSFRVLRGGCWFFFERDCRSAYRLKRVPGIRNCIFGFRLACSEKGQ